MENVDLVAHNDYGITCIGGNGACVDLDGTTGPGSLMSQYFSFNAGDRMKFSVQVSGNQRNASQLDDVTFDLAFSTPVTIGNYLGTGGWSSFGYFGVATGSLGVVSSPIAGNTPYSLYTFEFEALSAGSVMYTLGTNSADNVGPVIDEVQIDRSTVTPEPATWAMLAFGMSAVGVASRRRVRKA